MKKVLLACLLVLFAVFPVFASEFLGGRWGVGIEAPIVGGNDLTGEVIPLPCENIFVSYDPVALSALQVRLGLNWQNLPNTAGNNSGADSLVKLTLTGLYRITEGAISPYIGLKLGVENKAMDQNGDTDASQIVRKFAAVLLGAEWKATDRFSCFISWNLLTMQDITTDGTVTESRTVLADDPIFLGAALYF